MARVSFQQIPEGFEQFYKKTLAPGDRFTYSRIRRKPIFQSRRRKKGVSLRSTMPLASDAWATFDQTTKDAWISAGEKAGMSGFKLFWRDLAGRLRNDLTGYSTPSDLYQVHVGRLEVEAPASNILIAQFHPETYWLSRKVRGTRNQRVPVLVDEDFDLPLSIAISYKTDLVEFIANIIDGGAASTDYTGLPVIDGGIATAVHTDQPELDGGYSTTEISETGRARFYARVLSHYQGRDIETDLSIEMGMQDNWQRKTASISNVLGKVKGYVGYMEIENARGDLFFDLVEFIHSGQNWARDRICNDINQGFTKVFAQVPKHWAGVDVPPSTQFESFYYNLLE